MCVQGESWKTGLPEPEEGETGSARAGDMNVGLRWSCEAGGGACGWGAPAMGGTGALQAWPSLPFQRLLGLRHHFKKI